MLTGERKITIPPEAKYLLAQPSLYTSRKHAGKEGERR